METIEERAMMLAEFVLHEVQKATYNECVKIVTEIDRIARQEERERCIKAAQKLWCKNHCYDYNRCIHGLGNTRILREECMQKEEIRKAIEEGGNK